MAHDPKKLVYWADHYRCWQRSGLSQRRYCEQAELSYSSFEHWRPHARELINSAPATPATPAASQQKLTLVPVKLDEAIGSGSIELRSPGGWSITVLMPANGVLIELLSRLP
jgi:hypothetical protein